MAWQTAPLSLLNSYRVSHNLSTPAAFTTPLRQALLANSGIGRQSPTMARKKEKRRVSKEQLALQVRKHFNGAAVSEIDVVVDMMYKIKNQGRLQLSPLRLFLTCNQTLETVQHCILPPDPAPRAAPARASAAGAASAIQCSAHGHRGRDVD